MAATKQKRGTAITRARARTAAPAEAQQTPAASATLDGVSADTIRQASIERAKLEWESTADALAGLVCLLGRDGKVMRTNRVVEDWSLGTVGGVQGVNVHRLLHPNCRNTRCPLGGFFKSALAEIRNGARDQFELQEPIGDRFLHFTLRPMRHRLNGGSASGEPQAVLVATDLSALYRVQDALEKLNLSLEDRVRTRTQALADANRDLRNEIVRRERAEVALRASRNELMALSEQLIGAQEGERKRIAVELHDSVGQSLSAVKYTIERGLELLRQPQLGDAAAAFKLAVRRIQESADSIRSISINLRPKILDDLGAISAIQWFCREFSETYPTIAVSVDLQLRDQEVPDRLSTVLYRCTQELLNNVAKHAQARTLQVKMAQEDGALTLEVRDNGVGLEQATAESRRHGSGLRNLRERAQMTGGTFSVLGAPGGGTLAQLTWRL